MPKGPFIPCDSLAAERARGLVWASVFRSAADEVAKGGVITGTPVIQRGVTLNGTTDYITYALNGQLAFDPLSVHLEFYPGFDPNDGIRHRIVDAAPNGSRVIVDIRPTGAFEFSLGAPTSILYVDVGTYQGYWNTNDRNLVTLSATTGANNVWLNGNLIGSSVTAWSMTAATTQLLVGQAYGLYYSGIIKSLKFFNALLTEGEHLEAWNRGT